jgi:hypothetical protein
VFKSIGFMRLICLSYLTSMKTFQHLEYQPCLSIVRRTTVRWIIWRRGFFMAQKTDSYGIKVVAVDENARGIAVSLLIANNEANWLVIDYCIQNICPRGRMSGCEQSRFSASRFRRIRVRNARQTGQLNISSLRSEVDKLVLASAGG